MPPRPVARVVSDPLRLGVPLAVPRRSYARGVRPDAMPTGGGGALFKQRTVATDRPEVGDAGSVLAATDRHPLSGRGHDVGVEVDLEDFLGGMSRVRGVSTTT